MKVESSEQKNGVAQDAITQPAAVGPQTPVLAFQQTALDPSLYLNREMSLLGFNAQVLDQAFDERNPLLERLKFFSIFNSTLDEFFTIRVSGIREQVIAGIGERSPDGMTPVEEMQAMRRGVLPLLDLQGDFLCDVLKPALARQGILISNYEELSEEQKRATQDYFYRMVFPVCTPLAVDPGHPFPHISNLSLNLAVELQDPDGRKRFARVKVPNVLPRLVPVPAAAMPSRGRKNNTNNRAEPAVFVWLEQVLAANLSALFPQMQLVEVHPFRVIRDADLEIQELEADDLLETVEQSLSQRRFGLCSGPLHQPRHAGPHPQSAEREP